jgi:MFS family permease
VADESLEREAPVGQGDAEARRRARRTRAVAAGTGRHTRTVALATGRGVRRATHASGAGETGLGRLIELHAVHTFADTLLAISLAGTLFFSVPAGEARGRVALFLLVTMAPFALVAPVIGPLLDRVRSGRRYALATTMLVRAFLVWVIADAVTTEALSLYPAAFGALVASKAYLVARSATVPRLLPATFTLVRANARTSLAGVAGAVLAAPIGLGLSALGAEWALRAAFVVYLLGMVLSLRLPQRADSSEGEQSAGSGMDDTLPIPRLSRVGPAVVAGLRANVALRAFIGFLTVYLAFLLRQDPLGGLSASAGIGLVVAAAALGNGLGTVVGSWLRVRRPETLVLVVVGIAAAASLSGVLLYGLVTVLVVAAAAGLGQSLGKLALDALLQRDTPEAVRTSAFARSETALQLAWVVGGLVGIALPLNGMLGFGVAGAGLLVTFVLTARAHRAR